GARLPGTLRGRRDGERAAGARGAAGRERGRATRRRLRPARPVEPAGGAARLGHPQVDRHALTGTAVRPPGGTRPARGVLGGPGGALTDPLTASEGPAGWYGETSIAGSSLATGPPARYRGATPSLGDPVGIGRLAHRAAIRGDGPRDAVAALGAGERRGHEGAPASDRLSSSTVWSPIASTTSPRSRSRARWSGVERFRT